MDAEKHYLKGQYSAAAGSENDLKTISYKIGGLVFTGQHQEARLLYKGYVTNLPIEAQVVANFHLGLSYTRTSEYEKGREYFVNNLLLVRAQPVSLVAQFFAYQGSSFYRFFFSEHRKSQTHAEKGYGCLLQMQKAPPLLLGLSLDIQAHNKIQLGYINQGLKLFEKALAVTGANHLHDLFSEIEISYFNYRSEFSLNLSDHIRTLQKRLDESRNQNDYSNSATALQVAKLYLLQGQFHRAHNFLNSHFDVIYKNQNKRKIAILNTLMAQLVFYKGQFLEALSLINVALGQLNSDVDRSLFLPLLGLKIRCLKFLGKDFEEELSSSEKLIQKIDRTININIQNRISNSIQDRKLGEDPLGDLFDKVHKRTPGALLEILESGVLLLVFQLFELNPNRKYIIICEAENTTLLVDSRQVVNTGKSLTRLQIDILNKLYLGPCTKSHLIESIWGYDYDPLRHDSLVYTAIGRIRKIMEPNGSWLYSDDNHYSLAHEVEVVAPQVSVKSTQPTASQKPVEIQNLNHRQLQMLAEGHTTALSASQYGEIWNVTRMTALRDLSELVEKGMVVKLGRGKATRYQLI